VLLTLFVSLSDLRPSPIASNQSRPAGSMVLGSSCTREGSSNAVTVLQDCPLSNPRGERRASWNGDGTNPNQSTTMETTVKFNTAHKPIPPEHAKSKAPQGKMYDSPADLAALVNDNVEAPAAEPVNIFDMPFADRFKVEAVQAEAPAVEAPAVEAPAIPSLPPMAPSLEAEAVEIVSLLNDGVNRFVEAGRKLLTHKARIDEAGDDWGLWVATAFPAFAPRTLGRYMTLARRAEDGEAVVMLPASEDSEGPGDVIGLVPPVRDIHDLDETRLDPGDGEDDDAEVSPMPQQEPDAGERRREQNREAQARRAAKLAEAAGRTVKPRKAKEPTTIHVSTRSGTEKAVYDRVMFMVERAEDEDQLRMIERHISEVFPELARLATEAGLTA
jgi:hypothetical protein